MRTLLMDVYHIFPAILIPTHARLQCNGRIRTDKNKTIGISTTKSIGLPFTLLFTSN